MDISESNEHAFICACRNGHLVIAQWLFSIKPTIADNENAFRIACLNDRLVIAQWLQSLKPDVYILVIENNKIINYKVIKSLPKHNEIMYLDKIEDCPICSENKCDLKTSCNHTFCESCIQTLFIINNSKCPYCRHSLTNTLFQPIQLKIYIYKLPMNELQSV